MDSEIVRKGNCNAKGAGPAFSTGAWPFGHPRHGDYRLLRDLGPVKGAKGKKHHEVLIDFSQRGLLEAFVRLISRKKALH
jgi:hypothetical protein